ncbi:MAG: ferritin-like domain-containing protein [Burkholderiaceae bacterium]|nr:ferritin-like domain-containing protein [Burkholderiaceae bacterium]
MNRELRRAALEALLAVEPDEKLAAVTSLARVASEPDPSLELAEPPGVPGRPDRPVLVAPGAVASRAVATDEGRAALLHALAHIEFNAVNLALDAVWRFPAMPRAYYFDWLRVAAEEVLHFRLLCERLATLDRVYGDFPAHDGLWEMARKTAGDVLARMALVPRTLEARGLDASPQVRAKFAAAGDVASAAVVDVILRDEIDHVAIGNRWFAFLCGERGVPVGATYERLCREHAAPRLRGPLNLAARRAAGFSEEELAAMARIRLES